MNAVDSSVVVAAFASWHALHDEARCVLDDGARLPAQAALESYSVLTRLPPPHRAPPELVGEFLAARFPEPYLDLGPGSLAQLVRELVELGITGGASYDAVIAATARDAGAVLVSCDRRARATYGRVGAAVTFIG